MAKEKSFVKFCFNSKSVGNFDFVQNLQKSESVTKQVDSFSEWGLNINPKSAKFGHIFKANFAFVPTVTLTGELDQVQALLELGASLDIEDFLVNLKEKFIEENITFEILEQKENVIYIAINPKEIDEKSPSEILKGVIELIGGEMESNYCKYFVNNCLIIDGLEAFGGEKSEQEIVRKELNELITEMVSEKKIKKTVCESYEESFDFRPFFGDGLKKLPKYDGDTERWDWDEIYINPGMDSEKFVPEVGEKEEAEVEEENEEITEGGEGN